MGRESDIGNLRPQARGTLSSSDSRGLSMDEAGMPPILAGQATPEVRRRVREFYQSIASIFESWVNRRDSLHTRRAYRADVMAFVQFMGWRWPRDATEFLRTSITDVLNFRNFLVEQDAAPKTINRRISSLSSFYKYLGGAAAELRLPITVPNPAHAQFIARSSTDPRDETHHLSATRARQLMSLPEGDDVFACRDRALLKVFLYTGARLGTVCRLKVSDFHQDGDEYTLRLHEKGNKRRTIGIHYTAGQAIQEYIDKAGVVSGALFRPKKSSRSGELGERAMDEATMWRLILGYLRRLPGAMKAVEDSDGSSRLACIFTPHSLRATTATLLLDAGEDITKVQALLGHRHITTTQIYDKRRRASSESASHHVPI